MSFILLLLGGILLFAGLCLDCPMPDDATQMWMMAAGLLLILLSIVCMPRRRNR